VTGGTATGDARAAIDANPLWYHVIEVAPGVETPGWFDLRPIVDKLPWPDVAGKRCLDVGTYDGFLAFELERRGAAEVVATDILDHTQWDWPPHMRAWAGDKLREVAGVKGEGFRIAKEVLGSKVERVECSVYELSPERLATFDVVVCGSLMLHLRDPLRALEAIRSVCGGKFLSAEQIRLGDSLLHPRRPLAALDGASDLCQWWIPTAAGHRRMVYAAGFEIERYTRPYSIPYGGAATHERSPRVLLRRALRRVATGNDGVPHAAVLASPRV
jgi:tRNA (mo5U34)-methyltransferase